MSEAPPDKPSLKHTLNLPQTEFAMQAKLANREPERLQRWKTEKLYERIQADTAGRPEFLLVDGAPAVGIK